MPFLLFRFLWASKENEHKTFRRTGRTYSGPPPEVVGFVKTKVSTCPESNMKLASGIAPLTELIGHGISIGLGTDSSASNNSLDLFSEMNTCAKIHKVRQNDPTVLPARQVLKMATTEGATVLGLQNKIGSLTPGKAADLIVLNLNKPHLIPFYSPDLLVYAAKGADVTTVIINGRLSCRKINFYRSTLTRQLPESQK